MGRSGAFSSGNNCAAMNEASTTAVVGLDSSTFIDVCFDFFVA